MSDIELKSCPFCGGEAEYRESASYGKSIYGYITCLTKGCRGHGVGGNYKKQIAIKQWNTRLSQYEEGMSVDSLLEWLNSRSNALQADSAVFEKEYPRPLFNPFEARLNELNIFLDFIGHPKPTKPGEKE